MGKAIYEGMLVDIRYASFFLAKLLGHDTFINDLASLDPAFLRSLLHVKHYDGDVEDLGLDFTLALDDGMGGCELLRLLCI